MSYETTVTFRGEQREVDFDYEGDGIIVWSFTDEDVCLGKDATELERQQVFDQLWQYMIGLWADDYEDYV